MQTNKPARWFRMYAEFMHDPKVQMLSESDQRRYIMLLCARCSNGDVTLQDSEVAFQLRISNEEWLQTKGVLLAKSLITDGNIPTSWDKRQYASDSSAERVSRHRALRKQACNVTVTAPETETEKETEKKNKRTSFAALDALLSAGVSKEVAQDWITHRKSKRASVTQTVIDSIASEASKAGLSLQGALAMCCQRGWQGFKAEWLREEPQRNQSLSERRAATVAFLTGNVQPAHMIEGEVRRVAG